MFTIVVLIKLKMSSILGNKQSLYITTERNFKLTIRVTQIYENTQKS